MAASPGGCSWCKHVIPRNPGRRGFIVGAHFAVGDGDMGRMGGVALECLGGLEGGVQHQVGVGRGERVDVDADVHQTGDLTGQSFQTFFDACLDGGFSVSESSSLSCHRITCLTIRKILLRFSPL